MDLKYEPGAYFPESFPRRRGDGPQIRTKFVRVKDFREEPVIEFAADRIVGQTGEALEQRRVSVGAEFLRCVSLLLRESVDVEDRLHVGRTA